MADTKPKKFGSIGFLMKFCTKRLYAEELLGGTLHCNRVSWFRDLDDPKRGDRYEGSRQLEDSQLQMQDSETGQWLSIKTVGPIGINYTAVDNLALFCTSLVRSGTYDQPCQEMIDEFSNQLRMSLSDFIRMGQHAVVIHDIPEFFRRVDIAAKREKYTFQAKSVSYYDSYPRHILLEPDNSIEPVFHKHKSYCFQKEHRIAIRTNGKDTEVLRLNIDDIQDISNYEETATLLNGLQFRIVSRNVDHK